jgi:CDP-ribitol ribitolphosphotransferase
MASFIKMILQIARQLDLIVYYIFYRWKYNIINNQVLFLSQTRNELTGNFEFIYNEIKADYLVKTALGDHIGERKELAKTFAMSHYILVDDFTPIIYPIPLRKGTHLIQVWHALGAFKTIGFARSRNHDRFSMTHRNYDDTIVSSASIVKVYAKAFRMNEKDVHPIGIPRTDIFFNERKKASIRFSLYREYPWLKGKKVILFAPTFRGGNIHNAYYDYSKINFKKLQMALGDEYACIVKMHPFISQGVPEDLDPSFYIDLSSQRDINDLLMITDILITDYSSVIFEAALLPIKTIFFIYDLENYIADRDFFYPFEKYTYGPVAFTQEEMIDAILYGAVNEEKKKEFVDYFINACDGYSSKRFVETLMRIDI